MLLLLMDQCITCNSLMMTSGRKKVYMFYYIMFTYVYGICIYERERERESLCVDGCETRVMCAHRCTCTCVCVYKCIGLNHNTSKSPSALSSSTNSLGSRRNKSIPDILAVWVWEACAA